MKKGPHFYICWLIRLDFAGSQTKGLLKKHHVQFPLSSTKKHSLIFSPKDYRVCWFPWVFHRFLKKKNLHVYGNVGNVVNTPQTLGFFSTSKIPAMGIFQKTKIEMMAGCPGFRFPPPAPFCGSLTSMGKRPCTGRMSKAWHLLLQSQLPHVATCCEWSWGLWSQGLCD